MSINPSIFKAYDVRGLYPSEVNEDAARLIGRGFVSYLQARRIAVSRDMRLSSPSVAAAFIDGARAQGADVVDYGMMGTDMLYYAVARDGHDGGAQITASHNPKEYNGIKMVRKEAFPLSGDAGIGDIRDMIATGRLPKEAGTPGGLSQQQIVDDYVETGAVVHRSVDHQAVQRRPRRRQRHRRHGGAAPVQEPARAVRPACASRSTAPSRTTRRTRSSRRTARTSSSA